MASLSKCTLCGLDENRIYLCEFHQKQMVDSFALSHGVLPWDDVEESRPRQANVEQLIISYDNYTIDAQGESKRFL